MDDRLRFGPDWIDRDQEKVQEVGLLSDSTGRISDGPALFVCAPSPLPLRSNDGRKGIRTGFLSSQMKAEKLMPKQIS
jgi:hypothetical protein